MPRDPLLPPEPLTPAIRNGSLASREKSAVREAITNAVEGGSVRLAERLEQVYEDDGAKAYVETFIKVLEFVQPRLQRVTVQDPDGKKIQPPVINVSFHNHPGIQVTAPRQVEGAVTVTTEEVYCTPEDGG